MKQFRKSPSLSNFNVTIINSIDANLPGGHGHPLWVKGRSLSTPRMHLACVKMVPRALCTWLHSVPCALSDRDKLVPTVQRVPGKRSCPAHNKRSSVEPLWLGHPRPTPVVGFLETTDEDDHQQHTNNYQQPLTTANNHHKQPLTTANSRQQPSTTTNNHQ